MILHRRIPSSVRGQADLQVLPIAPSTYYENIAKRLDVERLSIPARRDIALKVE